MVSFTNCPRPGKGPLWWMDPEWGWYRRCRCDTVPREEDRMEKAKMTITIKPGRMGAGSPGPVKGRKKVSIRIEAQRVVVGGERYFELTKLQALSKKQLPEEYLKGKPCCYMTDDTTYDLGKDGLFLFLDTGDEGRLTDENTKKLKVGDHLTVDAWAMTLRSIARCGKRLAEVNRERGAVLRNWGGSVVVTI